MSRKPLKPGDRVSYPSSVTDLGTVFLDGKRPSIRWDADDQIDSVDLETWQLSVHHCNRHKNVWDCDDKCNHRRVRKVRRHNA